MLLALRNKNGASKKLAIANISACWSDITFDTTQITFLLAWTGHFSSFSLTSFLYLCMYLLSLSHMYATYSYVYIGEFTRQHIVTLLPDTGQTKNPSALRAKILVKMLTFLMLRYHSENK